MHVFVDACVVDTRTTRMGIFVPETGVARPV